MLPRAGGDDGHLPERDEGEEGAGHRDAGQALQPEVARHGREHRPQEQDAEERPDPAIALRHSGQRPLPKSPSRVSRRSAMFAVQARQQKQALHRGIVVGADIEHAEQRADQRKQDGARDDAQGEIRPPSSAHPPMTTAATLEQREAAADVDVARRIDRGQRKAREGRRKGPRARSGSAVAQRRPAARAIAGGIVAEGRAAPRPTARGRSRRRHAERRA